MRLATWNIRAGGGKRKEQIARVILEEAPDVLVLTEYRPTPGKMLLGMLAPLQYHVAEGTAEGPRNSVCVVSRYALEVETVGCPPQSLHRWMAVTVPELEITVLGAHVPNQTEIWNKRDFWDCLEQFAAQIVSGNAAILGDLNTALDEDHQGEPIREAEYLKRLFEAGWVDAWRALNPDVSEYTWFSHRANGFRIDHCLVSPSLSPAVKAAKLRHDVRMERLSDHSLLLIDLDLRNR